MPTGPGSISHRGGGKFPDEEDAIARLSNQLVQLSARVEADRQQRAKEAEAERKRQAGEVAAKREHTAAMLQDQLASMRQIFEKRSGHCTGGDRTGVTQDEPDGSIQAESRGVFGASQCQL